MKIKNGKGMRSKIFSLFVIAMFVFEIFAFAYALDEENYNSYADTTAYDSGDPAYDDIYYDCSYEDCVPGFDTFNTCEDGYTDQYECWADDYGCGYWSPDLCDYSSSDGNYDDSYDYVCTIDADYSEYGVCPEENIIGGTDAYECIPDGFGNGMWSDYLCSDYGECNIGEEWGLCGDFASAAYTCDDTGGYGYWSGYLCEDCSLSDGENEEIVYDGLESNDGCYSCANGQLDESGLEGCGSSSISENEIIENEGCFYEEKNYAVDEEWEDVPCSDGSEHNWTCVGNDYWVDNDQCSYIIEENEIGEEGCWDESGYYYSEGESESYDCDGNYDSNGYALQVCINGVWNPDDEWDFNCPTLNSKEDNKNKENIGTIDVNGKGSIFSGPSLLGDNKKPATFQAPITEDGKNKVVNAEAIDTNKFIQEKRKEIVKDISKEMYDSGINNLNDLNSIMDGVLKDSVKNLNANKIDLNNQEAVIREISNLLEGYSIEDENNVIASEFADLIKTYSADKEKAGGLDKIRSNLQEVQNTISPLYTPMTAFNGVFNLLGGSAQTVIGRSAEELGKLVGSKDMWAWGYNYKEDGVNWHETGLRELSNLFDYTSDRDKKIREDAAQSMRNSGYNINADEIYGSTQAVLAHEAMRAVQTAKEGNTGTAAIMGGLVVTASVAQSAASMMVQGGATRGVLGVAGIGSKVVSGGLGVADVVDDSIDYFSMGDQAIRTAISGVDLMKTLDPNEKAQKQKSFEEAATSLGVNLVGLGGGAGLMKNIQGRKSNVPGGETNVEVSVPETGVFGDLIAQRINEMKGDIDYSVSDAPVDISRGLDIAGAPLGSSGSGVIKIGGDAKPVAIEAEKAAEPVKTPIETTTPPRPAETGTKPDLMSRIDKPVEGEVIQKAVDRINEAVKARKEVADLMPKVSESASAAERAANQKAIDDAARAREEWDAAQKSGETAKAAEAGKKFWDTVDAAVKPEVEKLLPKGTPEAEVAKAVKDYNDWQKTREQGTSPAEYDAAANKFWDNVDANNRKAIAEQLPGTTPKEVIDAAARNYGDWLKTKEQLPADASAAEKAEAAKAEYDAANKFWNELPKDVAAKLSGTPSIEVPATTPTTKIGKSSVKPEPILPATIEAEKAKSPVVKPVETKTPATLKKRVNSIFDVEQAMRVAERKMFDLDKKINDPKTTEADRVKLNAELEKAKTDFKDIENTLSEARLKAENDFYNNKAPSAIENINNLIGQLGKAKTPAEKARIAAELNNAQGKLEGDAIDAGVDTRVSKTQNERSNINNEINKAIVDAKNKVQEVVAKQEVEDKLIRDPVDIAALKQAVKQKAINDAYPPTLRERFVDAINGLIPSSLSNLIGGKSSQAGGIFTDSLRNLRNRADAAAAKPVVIDQSDLTRTHSVEEVNAAEKAVEDAEDNYMRLRGELDSENNPERRKTLGEEIDRADKEIDKTRAQLARIDPNSIYHDESPGKMIPVLDEDGNGIMVDGKQLMEPAPDGTPAESNPAKIERDIRIAAEEEVIIRAPDGTPKEQIDIAAAKAGQAAVEAYRAIPESVKKVNDLSNQLADATKSNSPNAGEAPRIATELNNAQAELGQNIIDAGVTEAKSANDAINKARKAVENFVASQEVIEPPAPSNSVPVSPEEALKNAEAKYQEVERRLIDAPISERNPIIKELGEASKAVDDAKATVRAKPAGSSGPNAGVFPAVKSTPTVVRQKVIDDSKNNVWAPAPPKGGLWSGIKSAASGLFPGIIGGKSETGSWAIGTERVKGSVAEIMGKSKDGGGEAKPAAIADKINSPGTPDYNRQQILDPAGTSMGEAIRSVVNKIRDVFGGGAVKVGDVKINIPSELIDGVQKAAENSRLKSDEYSRALRATAAARDKFGSKSSELTKLAEADAKAYEEASKADAEFAEFEKVAAQINAVLPEGVKLDRYVHGTGLEPSWSFEYTSDGKTNYFNLPDNGKFPSSGEIERAVFSSANGGKAKEVSVNPVEMAEEEKSRTAPSNKDITGFTSRDVPEYLARGVIAAEPPKPGKLVSEKIIADGNKKLMDSAIETIRKNGAIKPEQIEQIVYEQAKRLGFTPEQIESLKLKYPEIEAYVSENLKTSGEFAKVLKQINDKEPATNVHLMRDGISPSTAETVYRSLMGEQNPDVRTITVSRDTISCADQGIAAGTLRYQDTYPVLHSLVGKSNGVTHDEFAKSYSDKFEELIKNPKTAGERAVAESVPRTYQQMQDMGLFDNLVDNRIRFVDVCCAATLGFYLEAVVRHYRPDIKTDTRLISTVSQGLFNQLLPFVDLSVEAKVNLEGGNFEKIPLPVAFEGYEANGGLIFRSPDKKGTSLGDMADTVYSINPNAEAVISVIAPLTAARIAAEQARADGGVDFSVENAPNDIADKANSPGPPDYHKEYNMKPSERSQGTKAPEAQVYADVTGLIEYASLITGIDIPPEKMPKIEVWDKSYSAYSSQDNVIHVARSRIGDGDSYSAEIGHFLRALSTGEIGNTPNLNIDNAKVHEFYDRVTSNLLRDASRGSEYEHLFSSPEIDFSNPDMRKELANWGRAVLSESRKNAESNNKLLKGVQIAEDAFNSLRNALGDLRDFKTHAHSYSYADMQDPLEIATNPDFYRMDNAQVKDNFLKKQNSMKNTIQNSLPLIGNDPARAAIEAVIGELQADAVMKSGGDLIGKTDAKSNSGTLTSPSVDKVLTQLESNIERAKGELETAKGLGDREMINEAQTNLDAMQKALDDYNSARNPVVEQPVVESVQNNILVNEGNNKLADISAAFDKQYLGGDVKDSMKNLVKNFEAQAKSKQSGGGEIGMDVSHRYGKFGEVDVYEVGKSVSGGTRLYYTFRNIAKDGQPPNYVYIELTRSTKEGQEAVTSALQAMGDSGQLKILVDSKIKEISKG